VKRFHGVTRAGDRTGRGSRDAWNVRGRGRMARGCRCTDSYGGEREQGSAQGGGAPRGWHGAVNEAAPGQ
jgi:hypothetical protein